MNLKLMTLNTKFFHTIIVPHTLQPYILYESLNVLGHNGPIRLYNFIKRCCYWKKLCQHCNKYVRSCSECQQVTLKEAQYVNLHLPILQFPMSVISMDPLCPYYKTIKGKLTCINCYIHGNKLCIHDPYQVKEY